MIDRGSQISTLIYRKHRVGVSCVKIANLKWDKWANEHEVKAQDKFDAENGKTYFEFQLSKKDMTLLLYRRGLQMVFFESIYNRMSAQCGESSIECYSNSFYASGLYGILDEWVKRDFHETPAEMMEIIKKITLNAHH